MKLGIQLPTWGVTEFGAQRCLELALQAEQAGFDSVWAGDHLIESPQLRELGRGHGQLEAFTLLGGIAATTCSVQLGTCVAIPIRQPVQAWAAFATLGHLAPGRVVAGLGVGGFAPEFQALGLDFGRRAGRLDKLIALLQNWPAAHELHPSLAGWSAPARPDPPPPIWLGTSLTTGRPIDRVARKAAGWFLTYPTVEEYRAASGRLDAALERAGRALTAVTRSALFRCSISDDRGSLAASAAVLAAHDRALAELVAGKPVHQGGRYGSADWAADDPGRRHLIGGPQAIAERLADYRAAGMEYAVLAFVPAADSFRALDLFARQVMPALRA
jgi:alkanesulfonate monooxygenase SsuD/methylene tetrahydromethanopterin reductase-like flavin-dependent oxidoreductase (luciferase family)